MQIWQINIPFGTQNLRNFLKSVFCKFFCPRFPAPKLDRFVNFFGPKFRFLAFHFFSSRRRRRRLRQMERKYRKN